MRAAIRTVAGLFALLWAVPAFGIIDLEVTVAPTDEWRPVPLLDGGWGLLTTLLIAGGFALVALRPEWTVEVSLQSFGVATLIAISAALGGEPTAWWMLLALVVPAVLLLGLASGGRRRGGGIVAERPRSPGPRVAPALATLAAIGAVPWIAYAADMFAANRGGRPPSEITNGVNHWSIQGALALALVVFTVLAALRPSLRRFNAVRVGICATYLGVCSLRFPGVPAALPTMWAVLAVAWGVALIGVSALRRRRRSTNEDSRQSSMDSQLRGPQGVASASVGDRRAARMAG